MTEPQEYEPEENPSEPQKAQEPAEKPDSEKIKGVDPDAEIPSETQQQEETLKRYKEQIAGQTKGFEKLTKKIEELEEKLSQKPSESSSQKSDISDDDKPYADYYKKLGFVKKEDMEQEFEKRIAPLTEQKKQEQKAQQQSIINDFIKKHPELSKEEDPSGEKMSKVVEKLRRVAPVVPSNPNHSLKEDLELAYNWAVGKSDLEEFRQKAKASGKLEAFEALETQVGGGSSVTPPKKKSYTPEQEKMMEKMGVDDEKLSKKKYPKQE